VKRQGILLPFFLATLLILRIAAQTPGKSGYGDLLGVLAVSTAIVALRTRLPR
jgi:hypothetical protein